MSQSSKLYLQFKPRNTVSEDQKRILRKCLLNARKAIDKALDNNNFIEAKIQREIRKSCQDALKQLKPVKGKKNVLTNKNKK